MAQSTIRLRADQLNIQQAIRGLNETTTAAVIGCDRSTLRRIRNGESPSAAFIAGAVIAFQVPFEHLFEAVDTSVAA